VSSTPDTATLRRIATREELHRKVDALNESQLKRARLVVLDEVDAETSVESILVRHGERRLSAEEFEEHFGDLPRDGEG
jgi:ketosteroid isomerase-like protein